MAFGIDDALSIAGALGMFGGHGESPATKAARDRRNLEIARLSDIRQGYGDRAADEWNFFDHDNSRARRGTDDLLDYLSRDPLNDDRYAADLARTKGSLDTNIATARNNAIASNSLRGMGDSGQSAGIAAYLAAQNALGTAYAQQQVADANRRERKQNLYDYFNVAQGQADTDWNRGNQEEGAATNLTKGLADYWGGQYDTEAAIDDSIANSNMGALSTAATDLGYSLFGGGGRPAIATPASTPAGATPRPRPKPTGFDWNDPGTYGLPSSSKDPLGLFPDPDRPLTIRDITNPYLSSGGTRTATRPVWGK